MISICVSWLYYFFIFVYIVDVDVVSLQSLALQGLKFKINFKHIHSYGHHWQSSCLNWKVVGLSVYF